MRVEMSTFEITSKAIGGELPRVRLAPFFGLPADLTTEKKDFKEVSKEEVLMCWLVAAYAVTLTE